MAEQKSWRGTEEKMNPNGPTIYDTWSQFCTKSWFLNWKCRQYREIKWKPGLEPRKRSLPLIATLAQSQWHVTVTFEGSLHPDRMARADRNRRLQDLQNLCLCLDFDHLRLIDNTVTEILIKHGHDNTPPVFENDITSPDGVLPLKSTPHFSSEYFPVCDKLRLCVREDPFRVHFPVIDCSSYTAIRELSEITKIRQLCAGVHEVCVDNDNNRFVYKEIDKLLYEPGDSQVLHQELRNLQLFQDIKGIVQLVAAVVSRNPYHTFSETSEAHEAYDSDQSEQSNETHQSHQNTKTVPSTVLRGVLLEYYPNGTLADALQRAGDTPQLAGAWRRWAMQITEALARLHKQDVTHMDLKPSNVLISAESNAVLCDVSGIGGTTRDYLAPEMLDILYPLAESKESRICNDIWALGKMFMEMGHASSNDVEKKQLNSIAQDATADNPRSRPSLHDIASFLSII